MFANISDREIFKGACRSFAAALLWGSGEEFDDLGLTDLSDETMEFVAGEVFATFLKLRHTGKLQYLTPESAGSIAHSCALEMLGCGSGIKDHRGWPFNEDDLEDLDRWQNKRHKHHLEAYRGDDGKVYIFTKEHRKPISVRISASEGHGRFGAMFDFNEEAVSVDAAALKAARKMLNWDKTWIRGYEEIPG